MRYWFMSGAILLFTFATAHTQETKGKDKDTGKESKAEPKEPTEFMGKSYEAWRKDLDYKVTKDPSKRENAMKAILMFGIPKAAEAMPDIIADLSRHPSPVIDLSVRVNGLMALNTYFLHASNDPKKKAPDPKVVKGALAIYKQGLKDSQVLIKMRSIQGLQYLGPAAKDSLDDVVAMSREPSTWELRKEAIPVMVMLADHKKPETKVMLALKKAATEDPAHYVRVVGIQGLGMLGKDGALVDLNRALDDPSKDVRLAAVQSMVFAKEKAIVPLGKVIADTTQEKDVRLPAVQALGMAGGVKALTPLYKIVEPGNYPKEFRLTALNTISALKNDMSDNDKTATVKKLAAPDPDPIVDTWRNATIMNINGKCDKLHMAPILKRVNDKDLNVRLQALQAIMACGADAKPFALQTVTEAVGEKDLNVASAAIHTLVGIYAIEAIPTLELITKDAKANEDLKDLADSAIGDLKLQKDQREKKKTPEKK